MSLIKATQSISTSKWPCQGETQTKLRVGGSNGKYLVYTLLIAK